MELKANTKYLTRELCTGQKAMVCICVAVVDGEHKGMGSAAPWNFVSALVRTNATGQVDLQDRRQRPTRKCSVSEYFAHQEAVLSVVVL